MKKLIIITIIITTIFLIKDLLVQELVIIPDDAIRLRVIANSDSDTDQIIKNKVTMSLEEDIKNIIQNSENINTTRQKINENMLSIDNNIKNTLKNENSNIEYKVEYGQNYFPAKNYKGVVYKEGKYESLIVTLGKGEGKNFWCVLFPPLCLLDKNENNKDIEYHLLVKDVLNKYLKK